MKRSGLEPGSEGPPSQKDTVPPEQRQDAVVIVEGPEARVRYVNGAGRSILHAGREDLLGRPIADLMEGIRFYAEGSDTPLSQAEWPVMRALRGEQIVEVPLVRVDRDGNKRHLLVSGEPLNEGPGLSGGALMVARDVTRLADDEAPYSRVLQEVGLGVVHLDFDGRITRVNAPAAAMLGRAEASLLGCAFQDLILEGDRAAERNTTERLLAGVAEALMAVVRISHPDGSCRYIRKAQSIARAADGQPLSFLCLLEDVTDERKLDLRLRESEAHLAEAQHLARLGSWKLDVATARLSWSAELARLYEFPVDEPEGPNDRFLQMFHPDDRARVIGTLLHSIETGAPLSIAYRVILESGDTLHVQSKARAVAEQNGTVTALIGVTQDVTSRKQLETRLREEQEHLREVQRLGRLVYFDWDIPRDRFHPSPEALAMLGLDDSWDGLSLERFLALVHPQDLAQARTAVEQAVATGAPYEIEFRIQHVDGHYLTLLLRGRIQMDDRQHPIRLSGAAVDLTARREAEEKLRRREADLAEAEQLAHLGNWTFELPEGTGYWSKGLAAIYGLAEAINFDQLFAMIHPDDQEMARSQFFEGVRSGQPFAYDYRIVRPDGEVRYLHTRGRVLTNEAGASVAVFGTTQDVTAALQIEHMKSEILSIVSHELRTPLSTIGAPLAMLEQQLPDQPQSRLLFEIVQRSVKRMKRLVEDILDMERLVHGRLPVRTEPTPLASLVHDVVNELQPLAITHGVTVEVGDLDGVVEVDPVRISQVLTNLLDNAIAFSPSGGTVTVRAEREGDAIRVSVQDRGIGVPEEFQEAIFEPFQQVEASTTRRKCGIGLGLPVARAILQQHGGRIGVDSTPGHGSTFWFTLPTAQKTGEA